MERLTWSAPEYTHSEKSVDWFWGLGLGALSIAVISIIFDNVLFAILISIAGFAVALLSIRKPREIKFELGKKGLKTGTTFYAWNRLESFWLEEETDPPKIILISTKFFSPHIVIPLYDVDPRTVHDILLAHLPEVEHHESIIDLISERLGF